MLFSSSKRHIPLLFSLFMLAKKNFICYDIYAGLDGEIAVLCNPQSAIVGLNACERCKFCKYVLVFSVMKSRSHAIKIFEPCQSLTAASLRGHFGVPWGSFGGEKKTWGSYGIYINPRCPALKIKRTWKSSPFLVNKKP